MNIFINTQFIILTLVLGIWGYIRAGWTGYIPCAAKLPLEAATASWEKDACARITGRLVINSALEGGSYKMNMLCSTEYMHDLKGIRNDVNNLIKSADHSFTFRLAAAETLHSIASADITGLTADETRLMRNAMNADSAGTLIPLRNLKSSPYETDLGICSILPAVVNTNCRNFFVSVTCSGSRRSHPDHICKHITREYETGHADYYRLYLYVKDHTGIADYIYHNTFSFLPAAHKFLSSRQFINNNNNYELHFIDNNSSFNICYVILGLRTNRLSSDVFTPGIRKSLNITILSAVPETANTVLHKYHSLNTTRLRGEPFRSSFITICYFQRGTI